MKDVVTRAEAKSKGLVKYFTGKPCKHGHIAERYVSKGECFDCYQIRVLDHRDKGWYRNRNYEYKYGLTCEQVDSMQANGCEICGSFDRLAVDHCHTTGRIRGTLCMKCNTAIGRLGDSVEGLQRAIQYLQKGN